MEKIHLPQPKVNELHAICKEHDNDPGELINILHAAQEIFGYLPREVQEMVAAELHIPVSRVYGVVTFYSFSEREIPYFRLSGNRLLCAGSRESTGRISASTGNQDRRDHPRRFVFSGLPALCRGLRTGSRSDDRR